jgi:hypothetical protein
LVEINIQDMEPDVFRKMLTWVYIGHNRYLYKEIYMACINSNYLWYYKDQHVITVCTVKWLLIYYLAIIINHVVIIHCSKHGLWSNKTFMWMVHGDFMSSYHKADTCTIYCCSGSKQTKFLAHLSWKLKWAILIAGCLSSVRPSDRLSVRL